MKPHGMYVGEQGTKITRRVAAIVTSTRRHEESEKDKVNLSDLCKYTQTGGLGCH